MKKISFGKVNKFFFIGGGQPLVEAVRYLKIKTDNVYVFTSERHYHSNVAFDEQKILLHDAMRLIGVKCTLLTEFDPNSHFFDEFDSESIMMTPSSEWIFSQKSIDRFLGRVINIHGSYLPEMKGGGGVSWNAMMGSKDGGVTIHMVDSGIDTGDILFQKRYEFPLTPKTLDEYTFLAETENAKAITAFLSGVMSGSAFDRVSQELNAGSYWPRLKTEIHGYINWSWSAEEIHKFVMAFGSPYSGAKTFLSSTQVNFLKSSFCDAEKSFHPFQYGIIYRVMNGNIFVAAKGGTLIIHEVNRSDGEVVNLNKLLGHRFTTPEERLTDALGTRVIFNPNRK